MTGIYCATLATPKGGFDKTTCHHEERGDLGCEWLANSEREIATLRSPESCHREERGDLGCEGMANSEREIASQARNPQRGR